jgi:hypothetical protein
VTKTIEQLPRSLATTTEANNKNKNYHHHHDERNTPPIIMSRAEYTAAAMPVRPSVRPPNTPFTPSLLCCCCCYYYYYID